MERPASVLPLGIALLMGAATFIAVNPPPAMRLMRYDEVVTVNLYNFANPCVTDLGTKAKNSACQTRHPQRPGKSLKSVPPVPYKMADPFWDRA